MNDNRGSYDRGPRGNHDSSYSSYNRGRQDNRRGPSNDKDREHKTIDYWEDIRTITDIERDVGKNHVIFNIIMQRPVFMGGEMGYYRLNTFLKVDGHYLRLSTSVLSTLANFFYNNESKILDAIDEVRGRNAKIDDMNAEQREKTNGRGRDGSSDRFKALDDDEESSGSDDDEYDDQDEEDNPEDDAGEDLDNGQGGIKESGPTSTGEQETGSDTTKASSEALPRRTRRATKDD